MTRLPFDEFEATLHRIGPDATMDLSRGVWADDLPAPTHVPIASLHAAALDALHKALSDEAVAWIARTHDARLAEFLSRVVLAAEQTRVYLGGREP